MLVAWAGPERVNDAFLLISFRENQNIFYFKKRKITRKFIDLKV